MQRFEDFRLSTEMLNALSKKGFEEPSEIQKLVVPELLKERTHLIGQAQTGTGKLQHLVSQFWKQLKLTKQLEP